ncbi:MAG TPA: methyltransferase [Amycolatopsis sp.]|uniref:methyltransferase family protein n=1 Tax=Amycolatopsis sp. TaxID=37632 RepID=UPI002B4671A8|nr:methyltransferase [Amycolatopsis sp.]HKS46187.1 methyltransferase [Amycolatopsis sp.]
MSELLDCLGVTRAWPRRAVAAAIWVSFAVGMVGIAAVQALVELALGASTVSIVIVVALVWVAWSFWHSHYFGMHRKAYLAAGLEFPYRRGFVRDIFPGITIGFSQMLRPAWNGVNLKAGLFPTPADTVGGLVLQFTGVVVAVVSFVVFLGAWRALGAARVGFAAEFRDPALFRPVRRGPYRRVRHPLFWSGIGVAWSLALVTGTSAGIVIAALNTGYGLVYNVLEDRRLCLVLGDGYARYAREVPRIVPLRRPGPDQPTPVRPDLPA